MAVAGIYAITSPSGKSYIGQAVGLRKRLRDHIGLLKSNKHPNRHLQNSWNKRAGVGFAFRVLEIVCDLAQLTKREHGWIEHHRLFYSVFNIREAADSNRGLKLSSEKNALKWQGRQHPMLGKPRDAETKEKIAEATKRQWKVADPRTGRKHSAESCALIGERGRGRVASDATRAKISAAGKGRKCHWGEKISAGLLGKRLSAEHREKIRQNNLGRTSPEETRAKMREAQKRRRAKEAGANVGAS